VTIPGNPLRLHCVAISSNVSHGDGTNSIGGKTSKVHPCTRGQPSKCH
jgi:hypothetical protein